MQMAAEIGASRRPRVQRAALIITGGDFGKTLTHDEAVPGLQMVERGQLAGRQILGKILYDRRVLTQEIADCGRRFAHGIMGVLIPSVRRVGGHAPVSDSSAAGRSSPVGRWRP